MCFLSFVYYFFKDLSYCTEKCKNIFKIKGIDVSHYQGIINWEKASKTLSFTIIKATEGSTHSDSKFIYNWIGAEKHRLRRGAYHFFTPTSSGKDQFEYYKKQVHLKHGDLPPIVDVELAEIKVKELNTWIKLATKHYGMKPIVYTYYLYYKLFLEGRIEDCTLWIDFNENFKFRPSFKNHNCQFWQYKQNEKIDGIDGDVDLDYFLGKKSEWNNMIMK